jgi:hypothetical protein
MKKVLFLGLFSVFGYGVWSQEDTGFRLRDYNRSVADSYYEQIIQVTVSSITTTFPMYDSYTRHNGDDSALEAAILSAVQRRYKSGPFEEDSPPKINTPPQGLTSAALRNNKDVIVQVADWSVISRPIIGSGSVNVTFHSYDKSRRVWYSYSFHAFF